MSVEERSFESGEEVWANGRHAIFRGVNPTGAAIVHFDGERQTRVVPMRKVKPRQHLRDRAPGIDTDRSPVIPPHAPD